MFFRKSTKSAENTNSEGLPPIPGAESRPSEKQPSSAANNDGGIGDDVERPISPAKIMSDDENDNNQNQGLQPEINSVSNENDRKEKPSAYIKPANYDYWVRALDVNGLIYYYNAKSGESTWLAPCIVCYSNGERFCLKCAAAYCDKHFQKKHKYLENPDEHMWSTQEQQTEREELANPDEQEYCIECQLKVANRLCVECWDPYCQRCFELVHHVGNLKTHTVMTYGRAHEGWFTVRKYDTGNANNTSTSTKQLMQSVNAVTTAHNGENSNGSFIASGISQRAPGTEEAGPKNASNKPGVMEYYVNGSTKEVTYEKPVELMNDLEKVLMQNWKLHQSAAEEYVQRLEEMQFELEKVKYERDILKVENAQMAQGIMPVATGASKKGKNSGASSSGLSGGGSSNAAKRPETPVLEKLIEVEGDEYRQKLLHPTDRKRGESRANYMKDLLQQPLPK